MDGNTAYMIIKTDDTKLSFYIFFSPNYIHKTNIDACW